MLGTEKENREGDKSCSCSKMCSKTYSQLFLEHPRDNGMTYCQHLNRALTLSGKMIYGSFALFVHGLIPYFFEYTGSNIIKSLNEEIHTKNE